MTLTVSVKLHAILKDLIPGGSGEVALPDGATASLLCDRLGIDEDMRDLVSINGEQALDLSVALNEGDRVEIFPAVLGGVRSPYLDEGLRLFREGDYFLAHETLEEHWAEAPVAERDFLQGLIHVCVGMHHHRRGNDKGALLQFRKAGQRLSGYGPLHDGVDLEGVRTFLAAAPPLLEAGASLSPPPV